MADSEQIRQQVKSPAPLSTWFGVVLLLFLFGAMAVAIIGPAPRGDTYEQKRAQDRQEKLKKLRDDDAAALNNYAWVDKTKGTVRVPIERAMELTVADLAKKKPAPAGPIATPAPETSAAPPGPAAASPAPVTSPQGAGTPKPTSVTGPKSEARGQPIGAINPAPAPPATQPGASASPAASTKSAVAGPAASSSPASSTTPPGSPLPVRGATASPSP
jgi:hypothetical protein